MKKIIVSILLGVAVFSLPKNALSKDDVSSLSSEQKEAAFKTGQTMAECSAFFRFIAELPEMKDKPNSIQLAENKANGWEMASMLFLLNGSSHEQQFHVKETIGNIVDAKKVEYKSRLEASGTQGLKEIQKEFDTNCMPLVPLQEKTVEVMRQGVPDGKKN